MKIECLIKENTTLKQRIELLEHIFSVLPNHVYWKDKNGVYQGCNDNQAHSLGLKNGVQIIGKKDSDLPWGDLPGDFTRMDEDIIKKKKAIEKEEKNILPDGKEVVFLSTKAPLFERNSNNVVGVLGISVDITDKKKLDEYKLKQKELELKSHYTKQAASSIAHDLRTPLASIHSAMTGIEHSLPYLIDGYQKAKEAGLQVGRIRKDGLEALRKITESCTSEIKFSNHYINLILANLDADEINTEGYKNQTIASLIRESLQSYPCSESEMALIHLDLSYDFKFWGDNTYIKNMINNLLKNALHYIKDAGKGEVFIKTYASQDGHLNYLSFKDTAKGASPEIVQRMFDSFYSKREGGTGLGLAFCKNIMNSFGGNIEAQSIEGEHMRFSLSFPKSS